MAKPTDQKSISPARNAAFDILRRVEQEDAYAAPLIAQLARGPLSREDRALAQELVLGVLRWQSQLDDFIARYTRRPAAKLDLPVRIALRLGLYQLRFLSRIPAAAAVNESVNLVKQARLRSAAPLVNAALRNAARRLEDCPGELIEDALDRLAIETAHPRWMLERWIETFGFEEARTLALANNAPPPLAFRVNSLRTDEEKTLAALAASGVAIRASEFIAHAFTADAAPALFEAAERGDIYFQDEASQLVSQLLDPRPGERVLDLCAAPGSKSSHLAALADGRAWIVACDIHPHRLATLATTCQRFGAASVDPVALDAAQPLPFTGEIAFDLVLVDAPCSGTGTLRRNPEIKWRLQATDIERLADLQTALLAQAAAALKPGGRLVYSTCSLEVEENEAVVRRFLESAPAFHLIEPEAAAPLRTAEGFVRTFPHHHNTDGFFAAVIERR